MRNKPLLSVVIATYRRPHLLKSCLEAVLTQTVAAEEYEIIVADDEPSDEVHGLIKRLAAASAVSLRYVAVRDTQGPAAARNAGAKYARGDVIAFTDDDTLPARDWLENGLRAFAPDTIVVFGRVKVPLTEPISDFARNLAGLEDAGFVTANAFVRKWAFLKIGGFDERFTRPWREDSDLFFRLLYFAQRSNASIRSCRTALVVHPVRRASWYASIITQSNNLYNALLFKKHPGLYRSLIQSTPPLKYYVIDGLLVCMATGLATNLPSLATGSLIGWIMATGFLAGRRLSGVTRNLSHVMEVCVTSALIPPLATFWRLAGAVRYRVVFF